MFLYLLIAIYEITWVLFNRALVLSLAEVTIDVHFCPFIKPPCILLCTPMVIIIAPNPTHY